MPHEDLSPVKVILLGPQRRPTVDVAARSLGTGGPVATITAGWQEREPDDAEMTRLLGGRDVNLQLYRRWLDVLDADPGYAAGEAALNAALSELSELYLDMHKDQRDPLNRAAQFLVVCKSGEQGQYLRGWLVRIDRVLDLNVDLDRVRFWPHGRDPDKLRGDKWYSWAIV